MGEIADAMVNGECCQECGQWFKEEYGYPVSCTDCGGRGVLAKPPGEDNEQ